MYFLVLALSCVFVGLLLNYKEPSSDEAAILDKLDELPVVTFDLPN